MRRVVRGFWGPREESPESLARRWSATLDRFARLLPEAGGAGADVEWTWRHITASGPAATLRPDEASLLDALRAARAADDWSAMTGTSLRLVADSAPGWAVEISGLAGGTPEFLLQSLVVLLTSPDDARLPDAELLTAVAASWQPDFGDVSDRAVTAALKREAGFRIGTPCAGWVTYLSPGRAARVPDGPATQLADGGALLNLPAPGDTAAVVRVHLALKETGALEPLPRPMNRPTL
ncbi:Imm52 family immunity protein [Streptomyces litchfieldiae]|uniref:Immunity protein 52 domain-containing protein n=1 Tax=Streptomyces litchfieldiae TaxID=3075543 RepID=A0ABU2MZ28_9ACTN|nr:Imm52 family immunity protein [Streptomyces sp. DSM 44938]MDT0346908.1 hypothetical protein [Streptomyces sp. DSM 44938]